LEQKEKELSLDMKDKMVDIFSSSWREKEKV